MMVAAACGGGKCSSQSIKEAERKGVEGAQERYGPPKNMCSMTCFF
jgi:hypothetical protein